MASISALSAGQEAYHIDLAREDYYTASAEPPGRWHGRGAAALGLAGPVAPAALTRLACGFSLGGRTGLVANAGSPTRQPGWDVTFSAPKSVSALWAVADEPVRRRVRDAHEAAVAAALDYLEADAGVSRRGPGGIDREPAGLVVAAFPHGTSRAQDPQLHTHCLVLNVGVRADGTTGGLESRPLYTHKMAAGAVYRAELAARLERDLGLAAVRERAWFELAGVPRGLAEAFSRRRAAIEAALAAAGADGAEASAAAALRTRGRKAPVPHAALFAAWAEVGAAHAFGPEQVLRLLDRAPAQDPAAAAREAAAVAIDRLAHHHSHFSKADLVRAVAEEAQARGVGAAAVRAAADALVADLVPVGRRRGAVRYATRETLAVETSLLDQVDRAAAAGGHAVPARLVDAAVGARPDLSAEQVAAVRRLAGSAEPVAVLSGLAGTGKTYVLDAAVDAWRRDGRTVLGCALSGKAARGLGDATGVPAVTLHRLLDDLEAGRIVVGGGTVVLVDEAGMVGTRQTEHLVRRVVTEGGGKLVLVGDARQLQPVEAGGPFRAVAARSAEAGLTTVTRQADGWFRDAVRRFAAGDAAAALTALADRGWVVAASDPARALIDAWEAMGGAAPTTT